MIKKKATENNRPDRQGVQFFRTRWILCCLFFTVASVLTLNVKLTSKIVSVIVIGIDCFNIFIAKALQAADSKHLKSIIHLVFETFKSMQ